MLNLMNLKSEYTNILILLTKQAQNEKEVEHVFDFKISMHPIIRTWLDNPTEYCRKVNPDI